MNLIKKQTILLLMIGSLLVPAEQTRAEIDLKVVIGATVGIAALSYYGYVNYLTDELHEAAGCVDFTDIQWLIKMGANIHSLDKYGYTPIFECTSKHAAECFINNGVDVNYACNDTDGTVTGWTVLHNALENPDTKASLILYLLDCGANVHAQAICHGETITPLQMVFGPYYEILNSTPNSITMTFPTLNLTLTNDTTLESFFYECVKARASLEEKNITNHLTH